MAKILLIVNLNSGSGIIAKHLVEDLVEKNPTSYTPDLAHELGNLGVRLSNLNQHKELLDTTEESITLYRSLVEKNPVSYTYAQSGLWTQ